MKNTTLLAFALLLFAISCEARTISAESIFSNAAARISAQLAKVAMHTNYTDGIASPENYALLKSTKLKDAAKKLALQAKLAEAFLKDVDKTEASRLKWHGAYARQAVDWDKGEATFYHADGYGVTVKIQKVDAQTEVAEANKRLPRLAMTNGVPARLAAARARRNDEKLQPTRTVTLDVDANRARRPNQ